MFSSKCLELCCQRPQVLNIFTIKCGWNTHCAVKTVFFLTPGYFLRSPDNSNLFRFPLKVRVIGSRLYLVGRHVDLKL